MNPQIEGLVLSVFGLLALLLGRRLFWMFAGIVGFALGWWLARRLLPPTTDPLLRIFIGVIAGLIVSGLARALSEWAIRLVTALAGLVVLPVVLNNLRLLGGLPEGLWAVIGAILGFVFALFIADWALIFVSSILGAGLILNGVQLLLPSSEAVRLIAGFILVVIGVVVQARSKH